MKCFGDGNGNGNGNDDELMMSDGSLSKIQKYKHGRVQGVFGQNSVILYKFQFAVVLYHLPFCV